ncbi:hypothetical protein Tco_1534266, partial [Tanacetum coccineum]
KTPELRPGYIVLNDSSFFLDMEGGSLAKSFYVVEGKYNLTNLVANCLKPSKNEHKFLVSLQVILSKSLYALSSAIASREEYASGNTVHHYSHLDITSDHRHGSAGNTSITLDFIHGSGRVHCEL